jgi:hypothetical protein
MSGKVPTKVLHLKTQSEKNDSEGRWMDKRGARNGQTGREWEMEERN